VNATVEVARADTDLPADRLDAFLARLDRVGLEDLRLLALPLPDADERAALLEQVDRVADDAGRRPLLDEARARTRAAIERAYARHQFEPTWAGLNWGRSMGTTQDRLGLTLAAEDAAVAAVMRDLLDGDTVGVLGEPFEHAAGMAGSTAVPSLSLRQPYRLGWLVWVLMFAAAFGIVWFSASGLAVVILIVGFLAVAMVARRVA
jgi:hypothetical protein